jgi:hypothetical protein
MESTDNTNSSGKGSSKGSGGGTSSKEGLTDEQRAKVKQMISDKAERDPAFKQELEENNKFLDEMSSHSDKMNAVLNEQTSKILKLHSIASRNDVRFIQEDGGLELSVPSSMGNDVAEKLSKEVGSLDRALQNKFSEYDNLSRKDIRLYNSSGTTIYSGIYSNNKIMYKELFESRNQDITNNKKKKIGTLKLVDRFRLGRYRFITVEVLTFTLLILLFFSFNFFSFFLLDFHLSFIIKIYYCLKDYVIKTSSSGSSSSSS